MGFVIVTFVEESVVRVEPLFPSSVEVEEVVDVVVEDAEVNDEVDVGVDDKVVVVEVDEEEGEEDEEEEDSVLRQSNDQIRRKTTPVPNGSVIMGAEKK